MQDLERDFGGGGGEGGGLEAAGQTKNVRSC